MIDTALELEGVRFAYGGQPVLRDLTLRLPVGAMAALIGPNGSGKSTLLNLACGVLRPDAGRVLLEGEPVLSMPPRDRARRVALVAPSNPAPFAFTVEEWISLGRTPYLGTWGAETAADRAVVERVLGLTDLAELRGRLVGELSSGERQRAALAQALAQEPRVLLLDEATAHLDLRHQAALLGVVRHLNQEQGLTVLAAIHDLNLAALWFDRLLLLADGELHADGPPAAVLRADLLQEVYGTPVCVLPHPTNGAPLVVPAPPG